MQIYTYQPPMLKLATKRMEVRDVQGHVLYYLQRQYKNSFVRLLHAVGNFDWYTEIHVLSPSGEIVYSCQKETKWLGHPIFMISDVSNGIQFHVTYKTWQKFLPEFLISNEEVSFTMRKDPFDWAIVYQNGQECARWKMKVTEWMKARLEISEASPIQHPGFFLCLFHAIYFTED